MVLEDSRSDLQVHALLDSSLSKPERRMMRYPVLFLAVLLAGCGFQEHQEQRTVQETSKIIASHERDVNERYMPPAVEIEKDPKTGTEKIKIAPQADIASTDNVGVNAGQKSLWEDSLKDVYPMGIKLMLIAFGLLCIFSVCYLGWKGIRLIFPASAPAAVSLADSVLAKQIHWAEAKANEALDPEEKAKHSMTLARLEKERGILNSKGVKNG